MIVYALRSGEVQEAKVLNDYGGYRNIEFVSDGHKTARRSDRVFDTREEAQAMVDGVHALRVGFVAR